MLFIGIDDTDTLTSPGTGRLARAIAGLLATQYPVFGITRHQLLQDPRVPMTAKNSANVIHVQSDRAEEIEPLLETVAAAMRDRFQPGSDPGLCVTLPPPAAITEFGRLAKVALVTAAQARSLADEYGLALRPLGGDGGGIIGALAAAGLAASGNDGRFTWVGTIRELQGAQPIAHILQAGVARVQTAAGRPVTTGLVDTDQKIRPSLLGGEPVLEVAPAGEMWLPIRRD